LRVQAIEEGFCVGIQIGHVQTHVRPNLPLRNDTFCADAASGGTLIDVLIKQQRFFDGYRPAVPVV
jgi:hypothetical protein